MPTTCGSEACILVIVVAVIIVLIQIVSPSPIDPKRPNTKLSTKPCLVLLRAIP